jgi:hypothetical protein
MVPRPADWAVNVTEAPESGGSELFNGGKRKFA